MMTVWWITAYKIIAFHYTNAHHGVMNCENVIDNLFQCDKSMVQSYWSSHCKFYNYLMDCNGMIDFLWECDQLNIMVWLINS